jgi:hypothetical protein
VGNCLPFVAAFLPFIGKLVAGLQPSVVETAARRPRHPVPHVVINLPLDDIDLPDD